MLIKITLQNRYDLSVIKKLHAFMSPFVNEHFRPKRLLAVVVVLVATQTNASLCFLLTRPTKLLSMRLKVCALHLSVRVECLKTPAVLAHDATSEVHHFNVVNLC